MKEYKEVQVVMLPTNKEYGKNTVIKRGTDGKLGMLLSHMLDNEEPQHLYFISEDKIKDGDAYFDLNHPTGIFTTWGMEIDKSCRKIVATSDTSLGLPLIPTSFIEDYVSKQGKINKVKLFCINISGALTEDINAIHHYRSIALTLDNEVIVKQLKESWNREEVEAIQIKAFEQGARLIQSNWEQEDWENFEEIRI